MNLIPGPTVMKRNVLEAYSTQLGSPDTEEEFWSDYFDLERILQNLLHTRNDIAIQSGEGMVALWGAMRSTIRPGDNVVCAVNGVFGEGFASMAKGMGANVHIVESSWRRPVKVDQLIEEIRLRDPKLVTMVHCETPSGVLNSLDGVGDAITRYSSDGLFLVDFVSSAMGAPLNVDNNQIDLGLLAPQKVLSGPPALGITTVSKKAWKRIESVGYIGYDALLPFCKISKTQQMPYTHNWHAVRATLAACNNIVEQGGTKSSILKHHVVAAECRELVKNELGLSLYCQDDGAASPTVTAVKIPSGVLWKEFNEELRAQEVFVGGSLGKLAGKVFRIGHMGTQADSLLVTQAVQTIGKVLKKLR